MNEEIWKDIPGYEGLYQASNFGNIRNKKTKRILKPQINEKGYLKVHLSKNKKYKSHRISRLIANTFIPNPNNLPQVNHKDENKLNNKTDNLEWCSAKYNCNYGTRNERIFGKLSKKIAQLDKNNNIIKIWNNVYEISEAFDVHFSNFTHCCNGSQKTSCGYKWKYIKG